MLRQSARLDGRTARHTAPFRHPCISICVHLCLPNSPKHHQRPLRNRIAHCLSLAAGADDAQTAADIANSTAASPIEGASPATAETPWRIYLGKMPLVGFEQIAAAMKGTPAHQLLQLHTYVLLEGPGQVWYFDFLPLNPTSPVTAAMLLTAGSAPGELRERRLNIAPVQASGSIRFLGESKHHDPLAVARSYNRTYNTQLHLSHNNCQQYTDGLISKLQEHPTARPAAGDKKHTSSTPTHTSSGSKQGAEAGSKVQ